MRPRLALAVAAFGLLLPLLLLLLLLAATTASVTAAIAATAATALAVRCVVANATGDVVSAETEILAAPAGGATNCVTLTCVGDPDPTGYSFLVESAPGVTAIGTFVYEYLDTNVTPAAWTVIADPTNATELVLGGEWRISDSANGNAFVACGTVPTCIHTLRFTASANGSCVFFTPNGSVNSEIGLIDPNTLVRPDQACVMSYENNNFIPSNLPDGQNLGGTGLLLTNNNSTAYKFDITINTLEWRNNFVEGGVDFAAFKTAFNANYPNVNFNGDYDDYMAYIASGLEHEALIKIGEASDKDFLGNPFIGEGNLTANPDSDPLGIPTLNQASKGQAPLVRGDINRQWATFIKKNKANCRLFDPKNFSPDLDPQKFNGGSSLYDTFKFDATVFPGETLDLRLVRYIHASPVLQNFLQTYYFYMKKEGLNPSIMSRVHFHYEVTICLDMNNPCSKNVLVDCYNFIDCADA